MSQPITLTLAQRAPRPLRWLGILLVLGLLSMPFLALLPASHPLAVPSWLLTLSGKILCYAIVAVALDLVWGYAGMLSLGHGIFFALGGYAMGMYLMRQAAGDGLPAFMSFLSWSELPWFWWGTQHFAWAMALVVLVPGLLALVFGWFAFRSKIKGVYFSIMTQALTYAGMLLFFRNETGFGGNNGFTGFTTLLGFPVTATGTRASLFMATVLLLLLTLWLGAALAQSKFGRILTAVRDAENRLMFCGYDPRGFKLLVWTLSAVLCGLAGGVICPAGRDHQPQRNVADQLHRGRHLGGARRARHPDWPGAWRRIGQRCEKHFHRGDARVLAAVSRPHLHHCDPVFTPRGDGPAASRRPLMQPDEGLFTRQLPGDRFREQTDPVLQLENINVSFDGFRALTDLSLAIGVGELRCVIGPNGAGKTTLMDVITGKTRPQSGKALYDQSVDLTTLDPVAIARQGIGRKFQKPTVFEALTVAENLALAMKGDKSVWASLRARLSSEQDDRLNEVLRLLRLDGERYRQAGLLSHGQKQFLEIGMLLVQEPHLLLLDEPAAGMTDAETEYTAELFRTLAGQHSLMVVEHDMGFVETIADRVTVLHQGQVLAEGSLREVQANEQVIEVYLGR